MDMLIKLLSLLIYIDLNYAAVPSTSWVRNDGLAGRLFGNPMFDITSPGRIDCGMACAGEACCGTLTFNPTTKSCTGYCRRKTTGDPFISDPGREVYHLIKPQNDHTCVHDPGTDLCFSLKTDLKTKYEAADQCQHDNGHLIRIDTTEKLSAVEIVLRKYYNNMDAVLIDGEDIDKNNNFKMSNGQVISLNNAIWLSGEPNGANEYCVCINHRYKIIDTLCYLRRPYLCGY